MKVLLVNGSPNEKGCTYTALCEVAGTLSQAGIETELFWLGDSGIAGCTACGTCKSTGKCILGGKVNEFIAKAPQVDGFVFGSPVHFASASGNITSFLDRAFYATPREYLRLKPAACVVSARRAGTTAALDQLNKYPLIAEMPLVASCYWNMVHGKAPEEAKQDLEGMMVMRTLGRNLAWLLQCKEAAKAAGIAEPQKEAAVMTNFIR
jgi:multimeric flavodoxin WrbA